LTLADPLTLADSPPADLLISADPLTLADPRPAACPWKASPWGRRLASYPAQWWLAAVQAQESGW
jgi:hypothetical protein